MTFSSPSVSWEHTIAASVCCDIFEARIVSSLVRGHERPDNKLTSTERARLTRSFLQVWRILMDNLEDGHAIQEQMNSMEMKDMFYIRETARFLFCILNEAQHQELARLMGDGDRWNEEKCLAKLTDIVVAGTRRLQEKNLYYGQPDFAPLGIWAFFDHWQEDYMEQFEEGYTERRLGWAPATDA